MPRIHRENIGDGHITGLRSGLGIVQFVNHLFLWLSRHPQTTNYRGGIRLPLTGKRFQQVIRAEFPDKPPISWQVE